MRVICNSCVGKTKCQIGEKYTRTSQIDSLMIVCVSTTINCFNILHALNQISYIHGHFIDLRRVKLLDISQRLRVFRFQECNRHAFSAVSPGTADSVDVVFPVVWQIVVYDQRDLLDVDTSGPNVRGD